MKRIILFALALLLIFFTYGCQTQFKTNDIVNGVSNNLREGYNSGEGIRIAVIDSGVSIGNESSNYVLNFSEEESVIDFIDHGVPIVDIIYSLAPRATVYSLKVINKYANASTQSVFNALEWCLNNSIDIINISLSFGVYSENIECIVNELVSQGVIIVASINNNNKEVDYPSMYSGVICVGKTDLSNLYMKATSINFKEDYKVRAIGIDGKRKDYVGNSFLAPIVTGIIACLIYKTNTEGSVSNAELICDVKFLLEQSNIKIN